MGYEWESVLASASAPMMDRLKAHVMASPMASPMAQEW